MRKEQYKHMVYYIHNMLRSLYKYFDDGFRGVSEPDNQNANHEIKIDNQTADHEVKIAKENGMYTVFDIKLSNILWDNTIIYVYDWK